MNEQMKESAALSSGDLLTLLEDAVLEAQATVQAFADRRDKLVAELELLDRNLMEAQAAAKLKVDLLEVAQQMLLSKNSSFKKAPPSPAVKGETLIEQVKKSALGLLSQRSHVSTREIAVTLFSEGGVTKKLQSQISTIMSTHPNFKADGRKGWVRADGYLDASSFEK